MEIILIALAIAFGVCLVYEIYMNDKGYGGY